MEWLKALRDVLTMAVGGLILVWPVVTNHPIAPEFIPAGIMLLGYPGAVSLLALRGGERSSQQPPQRRGSHSRSDTDSGSTGRGRDEQPEG